MATYTLRHCILENLQSGKRYITDLLLVFTQEANPFKVAVDKSNKILQLYENVGLNNEFVASWLSLMSYQPSNFETINVDVSNIDDDEEVFLKVCSTTKIQQKLFVYSHEGWKSFSYKSERVIEYEGKSIIVFDRDEAILELSPKNGNSITAIGSVIATGNSSISDSKNTSNGK